VARIERAVIVRQATVADTPVVVASDGTAAVDDAGEAALLAARDTADRGRLESTVPSSEGPSGADVIDRLRRGEISVQEALAELERSR
jgi:hypothetical protein